MRHSIDLLLAHTRELARHAVMLILLAGTVSGVLFTFSAGKLVLNGAWERIISVGGIALALEIGGVFTGLYIQQIDLRIQSAKRGDQRDAYRRYRKQLYVWFAAILAISFVANLLFRSQQLGDVRLAAFVSLAPIVLICLFTIVLRPLPTDYAELGRQATQRGLLVLTRSSQAVLVDSMRQVGRGRALTPQKQQAMAMAATFLRSYAQASEQQALDYAISQGGGADVVESSALEMWSSADIAHHYDIPLRTAQLWASNTPGRRRATKGNSWLVPAREVISLQGVPKRPESHYSAPQGHARRTQRSAEEPQGDATQTQLLAMEAQ